MNFEFLANELFLDIFEYLNTTEVLRIFHGLNKRLNNLLYLHLENFSLDFRTISKENFDGICQEILPLISDKIISIHLSNDDDTPDQPNLFYSYGFSFQKFINLQSLSLFHINSTDFINEILLNCSQLIYLNISQCDLDENICLNNIWSLPKLRYCHLNDFFPSLLTRNSLSIEELSIKNSRLSFDCLVSIFQHTPNLQNLNIKLEDFSNSQSFSLVLPLITKLKISFQGECNLLKSLLINLPNLFQLIIHIENIYTDGQQWEQLISNHLSKLKIFRLLMYYKFDNEENFSNNIDQLFESFQTKFWIYEHQWFIQYDQHTEDLAFHLYTLPYGFKKYSTYSTDLSKSTCSINDKHLNVSPFVHTLVMNNLISKSMLQFINIHHLELKFPFNDVLWSIIPRLKRLRTLDIISITNFNEIDQSIARLSLLINQAIYLNSLTIDYLILSQLSTISITNQSIHRLDLMSIDGHFYDTECVLLIQSLLNNQCEVLLINIENRLIILDLIKNLSNLRALTFQSQDDQWGDSNESILIEDELIQWLKKHLPSNCSIIRDEREMSVIRLWIR